MIHTQDYYYIIYNHGKIVINIIGYQVYYYPLSQEDGIPPLLLLLLPELLPALLPAPTPTPAPKPP